MTPRELRDQVIDARARYRRGEISYEDLGRVADAYIAAVVAYMRARGVKRRAPSRAYVLRAL